MIESLKLIVKPSTQNTGDLNPHKFAMRGQLVSMISDNDWINSCGHTCEISHHTRKVFCVYEVDPALKPILEDFIQPFYNGDSNGNGQINKINHKYRRSKGVFILEDLVKEIDGGSDLISKWEGDDIVPVVDLRSMGTNLYKYIKHAAKYDPSTGLPLNGYGNGIGYSQDINAISSGTWTVGSGGDYPNIESFTADDANLTGDLTADLISDSTSNSSATIGVNVGSYTYRVTSSTPHVGNVNAGYTISCDTNQSNIVVSNTETTGKVEIDSWKWQRIKNAISSGRYAVWLNTNTRCIVHDMFIDINELVGGGLEFTGDLGNVKVWNTVIWEGTGTGLLRGQDVRNCTIFKAGNSGLNSGANAENIENVLSFERVSGSDFSAISAATGNNNGSWDTSSTDGNWNSGSNNQPNLTTTNEIYTDDTNSNFAHVKADGQAWNGGNTSHFSLTDMAGVPWHLTTPSIGAFQFVTTPVVGVETGMNGGMGVLMDGGMQ